jgi:hypothetical protein
MMTEETKDKKVVLYKPWTWAPPAVICGTIADKVGLPNSPEGEPGLPVPIRIWLALQKPFERK